MHDIGKIGIPDAILLKEGKLTPEEFAIVQRNVALGEGAFEPMSPHEMRAFRSHTILGEMNVPSTTVPLAKGLELERIPRPFGSGLATNRCGHHAL